VIDDDELDLAPAELAAEGTERELEAVERMLAEHGRRPGEAQHDADLQLLLRLRAEAHHDGGRGRADPQGPLHRSCPPFVSFPCRPAVPPRLRCPAAAAAASEIV